MRHVLVMTGTGAIGLMALFVVDFLSLLYVSRLGNPSLTAAVGYSTQLLFFLFAISLGMAIAITAVVSRAIGSGDFARARELAASGLVQMLVFSGAAMAAAYPFRHEILEFVGARGEALEVATRFLAIVLPANVLLGAGMALSGILRAVGDARRSMYVTLSGGIVTAFTDPLFIFGFGFGVYGAAIAIVISRVVFVVVGLHGAVYTHHLVGRPRPKAVVGDLMPVMGIALPAIVTNLATPVANAYAIRIFAAFGQDTVAAIAIIDRIVPLSFGAIFALSAAVGPILGQNLGARLALRVRQILTDSFTLTAIYVVTVWMVLILLSGAIVWIFDAKGDTARLVIFFCRFGAAAWIFLGWLFVANAAFNNLGFPILSTLFNWGRATLGTVPFVTLGAHLYGAEGALMGIVAGAAIFGTAAVATAYLSVGRLARRLAVT
ncbi:MAG: MATE family efflux transporter [Methylobacteriaceae bacterium]|nr:MATE family efflux transporter [Methylobacteriaceae bacterium]